MALEMVPEAAAATMSSIQSFILVATGSPSASVFTSSASSSGGSSAAASGAAAVPLRAFFAGGLGLEAGFRLEVFGL